ncbi:dynamin family protein [Desulfobacterales bacterium HSG2]|nr:dynamin family protein [Desulfobacterales bacterium HSG2]
MLSNAKSVPGMQDGSFGDWEKTCADIRKQISEDIIRVAVVGSIKSGKSTYVNSLFKGDYLKRGAGVVTSIVTKIRKGEALRAELWFKSYDEVNSDMEHAMVLFPSLDWRSRNNGFDIRREEERTELRQAIGDLDTELLISNGSRSVNSVLLASYLEGYDRVKENLSPEETLFDNIQKKPVSVVRYEGERFPAHRAFVGDDALAVYLKDIQLEIDSGWIEGSVEIADCQGSDSPNPLHLAMIQEYLLSAHFIIYVVSSRTGIRQADIKFLSIIKKMGIMDNILFIINFDFNEHENTDDLNALIEKIKAEISLIKPNPEIYTLSALFNLFKSQKSRKSHGFSLSEKDRMKFAQWKKDKAFSDFSDRETERFESAFHHKLAEERYALLFKNHIERLNVISSGMDHWINVNTDVLSRDADGADEIVRKLRIHQKKMDQIRGMTETTLDGTVKKVKGMLRTDIDRFFDNRSGKILGNVLKFIRDYDVPYYKYEENLEASNFANTLYLIFQEFKHAVEKFMAETTNPEIIRFVRGMEKKIREHLESVTGPYDVMAGDALAAYNKTMEHFGIPPVQRNQSGISIPDMNLIKRTGRLSLPPLTASMRCTAKIKTEAVMRFGAYSFIRLIKKVLKRPIRNSRETELRALKNGVLRMKQETERSVIFHFKDYRENIKFQYGFKLTDALSDSIYNILLDRFQGYITDLSRIVNLIEERQIDKEDASDILQEISAASREVNERISRLRS